ncbi:MAG: isochorismate synthase [Polyangiaceae bacterium]|nr:isochorismate synthase [Polyangiaceae bacterium]
MTRVTAESGTSMHARRLRWDEQGDAPTRDALALLTVPAPQRRARALLRLAPEAGLGEERLLWVDPLGHESVAGVGAAVEIIGQGTARFEDVAEGASRLWKRIVRAQRPDPTRPPLRLFGGFAFRPGHATGAVWERFGDARFVLPRLVYQDLPSGALLTLVVPFDSVDRAVGERRSAVRLHKLVDALEHVPVDECSPLTAAPAQMSGHDLGEHGWVGRVERARREIAAGHLEKVVVARCAELSMVEPIDVHQVLGRLASLDPGCTLFALGWQGAMFVGATPERLVAKRGQELSTEALAGSCGSFGPAAAAALRGSRKDLCEHELVVRELCRALQPLCATVSAAARPEVRTLRHVLHLHTPISAVLRRPAHILELVERLHPTPAVGGVPVDAAVDWIAREEPAPRGWYASPVGWFDAEGDGRFAMALRSGVLSGHQAHLFAGAGIVRQSDPTSELEETRLKLQSLFTALGVAP